MKLQTLCICLLVITSFSAIARGEIITTGYWSGVGDASGNSGYSSVTAHSTGDDYYNYSAGSGDQYTYSTETKNFYWYSYAYTWSEVKMWLYNYETCHGIGQAEAKVVNPDGTDDFSGSIDWTDSGHTIYKNKTYGVEEDFDDGYQEFTAYFEGIDCEHLAFAAASVPQNGASTVHSHSDAYAFGSLVED